MKHFEANFDGLVGPTHNYAGLSFGNVASFSNADAVSNPKQAAKQGLAKAKALADMGLVQGMLAPQERPDMACLRQLGFSGTDAEVLSQAAKQAPQILRSVASASSMWTANAATVSPSADTSDGRIHFTPANLVDKLHRSIEAPVTGRILKATFANDAFFAHHDALPHHPLLGDEGAANHTRLCRQYGSAGVELFAYGQSSLIGSPRPQKFPARQTLEASQAVARLHGLDSDNTVFMQQNPDVIDQGVFHNDVISVGNRNVLFYHEQAFLHTEQKFAEIRDKYGDGELHFIKVPTAAVSIKDAVSSYLFNTQLVSFDDDSMAIIAPTDCQENPAVERYLNELVQMGTPINKVHFFDVKQSMQNGGGPACLRLRVAMNQAELDAVNPHTLMNDNLFTRLNAWVDKHYRDRLSEADLADPQLLIESRTALDELTQIMHLGSVYPFQR
ncbi:N-succinylarginine dihydrolase [Paraferrimonas sedimenticola]|uniref:N-succinylarginine dihydrolase n=1 Tax=Paraferrimonas sedimenticola TaxID=375674 RepID=A0AA37RPV1_9GAMM|nr:N-succinylarginine dihydrolase [Paraferrimonas sedimenticola]GLP94913.1 N-succinylarginine dihydrolase [Paraferrimonas sedimenticola]